ncbi:lysoplasmalogenase [Thalassotalea sp. M1531]|uniref:Lysoplasmalogenase n=2 Tax=Thalassotalea algicola TaxID=2716224 RepID=A0A7Y0LAN0_9GAMM|nr:lysoplasmalogenase [Thalassotalea algicola]
MLLILFLAITQLSGKYRILMAIGVLASCFGDVFLALPITNSFLLGLGAFLIAQLVYAVTYFQTANWAQVTHWRKMLVAVILLFSILMATYLLPDTGEMQIPVAIYLAVVCSMGIAAFTSALPNKVALGALSFIVSDSILAMSFFKTPLPMSDVLVMASYYLAQYLMVKGMIDYQGEQSA